MANKPQVQLIPLSCLGYTFCTPHNYLIVNLGIVFRSIAVNLSETSDHQTVWSVSLGE